MATVRSIYRPLVALDDDEVEPLPEIVFVPIHDFHYNYGDQVSKIETAQNVIVHATNILAANQSYLNQNEPDQVIAAQFSGIDLTINQQNLLLALSRLHQGLRTGDVTPNQIGDIRRILPSRFATTLGVVPVVTRVCPRASCSIANDFEIPVETDMQASQNGIVIAGGLPYMASFHAPVGAVSRPALGPLIGITGASIFVGAANGDLHDVGSFIGLNQAGYINIQIRDDLSVRNSDGSFNLSIYDVDSDVLIISSVEHGQGEQFADRRPIALLVPVSSFQIIRSNVYYLEAYFEYSIEFSDRLIAELENALVGFLNDEDARNSISLRQ